MEPIFQERVLLPREELSRGLDSSVLGSPAAHRARGRGALAFPLGKHSSRWQGEDLGLITCSCTVLHFSRSFCCLSLPILIAPVLFPSAIFSTCISDELPMAQGTAKPSGKGGLTVAEGIH